MHESSIFISIVSIAMIINHQVYDINEPKKKNCASEKKTTNQQQNHVRYEIVLMMLPLL